jgi:hypothetical protein
VVVPGRAQWGAADTFREAKRAVDQAIIERPGDDDPQRD